MVGHLHELTVDVFVQEPRLVTMLLSAALPGGLPTGPVRVESGEFSEYAATQWRCDQVLTFGEGQDRVAVVLEVQQGSDDDKEWVWPVYLVNLRARARCQVVVLVVCLSRSLARTFDRPIVLGPGSVVRPVVIGPDEVPVVADVTAALDLPELAVLSAIAHTDRKDVLAAAAEAFARIERERGARYYEVLAAELPQRASAYLKEVMMSLADTWPVHTEFAKEHFAKGLAEGEAKGLAEGEARSVLVALDARGIPVTAEARRRIMSCTDLEQLDVWLRRALKIRKIDKLFD